MCHRFTMDTLYLASAAASASTCSARSILKRRFTSPPALHLISATTPPKAEIIWSSSPLTLARSLGLERSPWLGRSDTPLNTTFGYCLSEPLRLMP